MNEINYNAIKEFIDFIEAFNKQKAKHMIFRNMNENKLAKKIDKEGLPKEILISTDIFEIAEKYLNDYAPCRRYFTLEPGTIVLSWMEPITIPNYKPPGPLPLFTDESDHPDRIRQIFKLKFLQK